ncbi:hypothetical protein GCM10022631_00180 [Deinococcus rubellus]
MIGGNSLRRTGHRSVMMDTRIRMAPIEQQVKDQLCQAKEVMLDGADQRPKALALKFGWREFGRPHWTGVGVCSHLNLKRVGVDKPDCAILGHHYVSRTDVTHQVTATMKGTESPRDISSDMDQEAPIGSGKSLLA